MGIQNQSAKTIFLIALAVALIFPGRVVCLASTYTVGHVFSPSADGHPGLPLLLGGSTLYGTAEPLYESAGNGSNAAGVIFAIDTNSYICRYVYTFSPTSGGLNGWGLPVGTNVGGAAPADLLLDGGTLYGSTQAGGSNGAGTIFKLSTNGAPLSVLHAFGNGEQIAGQGDCLVLAGGELYGLYFLNTVSGSLAVFKMDTNGDGFTRISQLPPAPFNGTTSYGQSVLSMSGSTLCIAANPPYIGEDLPSILYLFDTNGAAMGANTGADFNAVGGLVSSAPVATNNVFYGCFSIGGPENTGSVFSASATDTNFGLLHAFSPFSGSSGTNADGGDPRGALLLSGPTLYGTASGGGTGGENNGTIFQLNTDSTGFRVLYDFPPYYPGSYPPANGGGGFPWSHLVLAGDTLFGTCYYGGQYGSGTLFALKLSIPLNFGWTNNLLVLSWADPVFTLQSASTVAGPFTNVTGAISPYTNCAPATSVFFRLLAN